MSMERLDGHVHEWLTAELGADVADYRRRHPAMWDRERVNWLRHHATNYDELAACRDIRTRRRLRHAVHRLIARTYPALKNAALCADARTETWGYEGTPITRMHGAPIRGRACDDAAAV
ncbi:hypothetical protein [Bifidobacterium castoris]|nr:hypothetical protein [Bifidobacterium castoris]